MKSKRWMTLLLALLLAWCQLPAARAADTEDHTLIIATSDVEIANPRLEYIFFSQYPDGKIVYLEIDYYGDDVLKLLTTTMPDLIELPNYQMTRFTDVKLLENLYDQAFPDGFPEALAPQARHLTEMDGAMLGIPKDMYVSRWTVNQTCARKEGLAVPPDDWTINDLMDYYDAFRPDLNGDGEMDFSFIEEVMVADAERHPIITKFVSSMLSEAVIAHLNDIDYFLSDDFLRQLELSKLLSTSDKVQTLTDERGEFLPSVSSKPKLFEITGLDKGPYRGRRASMVPIPAAHEGESVNPATISYYCLMSSAPHHDLAVACMRLMASEAYQLVYDAPVYMHRTACFGAQEPDSEIIMVGGVNRKNEVFYSEEYHANVRIVEANGLEAYRISDLAQSPAQYQEHLEYLAQADVAFYNNLALGEINQYAFWPALKEYFMDNLTAEEVARVLYQRLRIAMFE